MAFETNAILIKRKCSSSGKQELDEKLCPEYPLRTDDMEYHIRPTDVKHSTVLTVGHEGAFKIKNNQTFLKVEDADNKTRTYQVVVVNPSDNGSHAQNLPTKSRSHTLRLRWKVVGACASKESDSNHYKRNRFEIGANCSLGSR
jgi:hypothetical protein